MALVKSFDMIAQCARNIPIRISPSGASYADSLKDAGDVFAKRKFSFANPDTISYLSDFFNLSDRAVVQNLKNMEHLDNLRVNGFLKKLSNKDPKVQKEFLEKIAHAENDDVLSKIDIEIDAKSKSLLVQSNSKNIMGLSKADSSEMKKKAYFGFGRTQDENFLEGAQYMQLGANGRHFDAHGIAKGNVAEQLDCLERILQKGLDPNKKLYTAPLDLDSESKRLVGSAVGTGGGTAYKHGSFILVSKLGKTIEQDGIGTVVVNKQFYKGFEKLQKAYPDVEFVKMCDVTNHFTSKLKNANNH